MGNVFEKNWRADINSFAQISFFASGFLSLSHGLTFSQLQLHSHEIGGLPSLDVRLPLQISTSPAEEMGHLACSALKAMSIYIVARATSPGN